MNTQVQPLRLRSKEGFVSDQRSQLLRLPTEKERSAEHQYHFLAFSELYNESIGALVDTEALHSFTFGGDSDAPSFTEAAMM